MSGNNQTPQIPAALGIVVIGRNEGQRLVRCFASLGVALERTVYVDSGSTDGSVEHAQSVGAHVIELDLSAPFNAARARNAGLKALLERWPQLEFVQFVDGDCEVEVGWLDVGLAAINDTLLAVVFGRRRERFRDHTIYNLVSDLEWDVPVGEVPTCGGDAMMRIAAVREVGGYDESLIAGEEPDLCRRMRDLGWRIRRIDAPMTIHDAALLRMGRWWRRSVRAGYVEGEGLSRLGLRYPRLHEALSVLFWTVGLLLILAVAVWFEIWEGLPAWLVVPEVAVVLLCGHLLLWLRIVLRVRRRWGWSDSAWYAGSCLVAKWAGLQGMALYWWRSWRGTELQLIEYKDATGPIAAIGEPSPAAPPRQRDALGVVVIGRNEGLRLQRCLASLGAWCERAVYVDSGSTDDSVAHARAVGVDVVELDMSMPFTAARGRNAGFRRLRQRFPGLRFVQFVDGDCEVQPGWLDRGVMALDTTKRLGVVFGRCQERERDASIYNRLCDLEWDVPIGPATACGGNAMMHVEALSACGGYDESLIAGEEPDLCYRLGQLGWSVLCVGKPMVVHDAAMTRFGQWWKRSVRAGFVEAEGLARLGRSYPRRRQALSIVFWSLLPIPVLALGIACSSWLDCAAICLPTAAVALLLAYGLLWSRTRRTVQARWRPEDASTYATFCILAKWPGLQGVLTFWWRRWRGGPSRLIEHKPAAIPAGR